MKLFTISFATLAVCITGNQVFAQDESGIPQEVIKQLDGLVGTWQAEGVDGDKKVTGSFTSRWGRGDDKKKCCLIGRYSYKTGDDTRSGVTLIGWNAVMKCIEDRGFGVDGGSGRLLWKIVSPTEMQGDITRVRNGEEIKLKAVLVRTSPTELVMESTTEDGKTARVVYTKVKEERKRKAKK